MNDKEKRSTAGKSGTKNWKALRRSESSLGEQRTRKKGKGEQAWRGRSRLQESSQEAPSHS